MKRFWTILALLGCLIQATIVPVHASMRAAQHHNDARLSTELGVICSSAGNTSDPAEHGAPPQPSNKSSDDCPICKATAAFQLALIATVLVGLVPERAQPVFARPDDDVTRTGLGFDPRSRGPPILV